uniref:Uncharacterized protein n=1 Tax=viral metagenome TaxID=1070528 RepID=A0A6C0CBX5_9ZZZZ
MGLVLLKFLIHKSDLEIVNSRPVNGVIYFRMCFSIYVCYISHDLQFHDWKYASTIDQPDQYPQHIPDLNAHFKTVRLVPDEDMYILIKQPTFMQIKSHAIYHSNMAKYLLLSQFLCLDINRVIINELFWLEMDHIYTNDPKIISFFIHDRNTIMKKFKDTIKEYSRGWMLP